MSAFGLLTVGTYHFHGDHLLALLLKYSAEQLNTLVNFESALLGLDSQFSVGVNNLLYVACTRARDQLLVSGVEPKSEFLNDFAA